MGHECCSQPAPVAELTASPIRALTEEANVDDWTQDCADDDPETPSIQAPQQTECAASVSNDCCSSGKCEDTEAVSNPDTPDCCRGKQSPCCNESCLDRLAMRECGKGAQAKTCAGSSDGKACNEHSLSILDRYGATLQALGCICRALIALGQETCCEIRERHSPGGTPLLNASSTCSPPRGSLDSCCNSGSITSEKAVQNRLRLRKNPSGTSLPFKEPASMNCAASCCPEVQRATERPVESRCLKPCCSKEEAVNNAPTESTCVKRGCCQASITNSKTAVKSSWSCCMAGDGTRGEPPATGDVNCCASTNKATEARCSKGELVEACCGPARIEATKCLPTSCSASSCGNSSSPATPKGPGTVCAKSCCAKERLANTDDASGKGCCRSPAQGPALKVDEMPIQAVPDIENQGIGNEHVVLSVSGMTCTGCETKLNRTLTTMSAVKNLKTSLILSRAEFDLDLRLSSLADIMKHLERTTEFKCERVQSQGSSLDIITSIDPLNFVKRTWPDGVIDMEPMDKQTVRVVFNPKVVGARDLTGEVWRTPVELAPLRGDPSLEAGSQHVRHIAYMTLLSIVLTIPVLVMSWAPLPERELAYSSASCALATVVQVFIAGPFYPKALKALVFSRVIEMDLLIVLSTSTAYVFSVVSFGYFVAGRPLSTGQFFETSTLLVTLIMVGRWVAAIARQRAVESISIQSLQSSTAILVEGESQTDREIDVRLLQYGDIFKVLPDTRIPTDGTVLTGSSEIDESMLTGESTPVEKHPGSVVIAGSINGSGVITVRLNRLPSDNTIRAISAMVDEAKLSKPKLQDLADRVASYFVPVIVALTIITFVIWVAVGMTVRGQGGSEAAIQAITYAITVLIVSCPCAIGLAVPMVIVIASGVAAEKGIIFKSAHAIEVAHRTSHVVFDKTGTLTQGKLAVVKTDCIDNDSLPLLLALVENSRHPVSIAVATHLKNAGITTSFTLEPNSLTGRGIEATWGGQILRAGNSRWLSLSTNEHVLPMLDQGHTVFCFTVDNTVKAVFGLQDEIRSDAAESVKNLQNRGISVHVVSGDDEKAVKAVAATLDIPEDNVRSRSSPPEKRDYIQNLYGSCTDQKKPIVVFCGDGTNDAVALAQATIGVHINEGTDVAQSAADVVLMRPSLRGILTMMNVSRKSVNRIKFNFAWSFIYNTFAVLLAAGAFVNARIPPQFAGLGEFVSVLPVIAAAVLLRWSAI